MLLNLVEIVLDYSLIERVVVKLILELYKLIVGCVHLRPNCDIDKYSACGNAVSNNVDKFFCHSFLTYPVLLGKPYKSFQLMTRFHHQIGVYNCFVKHHQLLELFNLII